MPAGIIIKGIGGFYYVKTGKGIYECKARGVFRKDAVTPLIGDRVDIDIIDEAGKTGNVVGIEKRDTQLERPAVANVDQIALVVSVRSPVPDFMLLDKMLIISGIRGIHPLICINKVDLDDSVISADIAGAYEKAGYKCILLSTLQGRGIDELKLQLKGHITALAGQSGVGKSTLLNKLTNSSIMQTGVVSGRIERGRHTTRHAELVELECGGYILDTPGFSSFELSGITHEKLQYCYPEFADYIGQCRFNGCSHINEPDCGVKQAVESGIIDAGRYQRYVQFYNVLKTAGKSYKSRKR